MAAKVVPVGLDDDGMLEVPPLEQGHLAGWYEYGPSPGEVGNSVIVGHVDSHALGPAVFFHLGALEPGDTIEVSRADGSVAAFVVDGTASYPKVEFPTDNRVDHGVVGVSPRRVVHLLHDQRGW